jgi:hypothetical protein
MKHDYLAMNEHSITTPILNWIHFSLVSEVS